MPAMDGKIVEFTALLRANGLRVSMSEHLDAFQALECLGIDQRESFKIALRATMVKRAVDVPVYDELFDLYFSGLGQAIQRSTDTLRQSMQLSEADLQNLMDRLAEVLEELGVELSELARALLQNDTGQLERLLRRAAEQANVQGIERSYQEGRFSHSTAQTIGLGALAEELDRLKDQLGSADLPSEEAEAMRRFLEQRLRGPARHDPPLGAARAGEARPEPA